MSVSAFVVMYERKLTMQFGRPIWQKSLGRHLNVRTLPLFAMDHSFMIATLSTSSNSSNRYEFHRNTLKRKGVYDSHLFYRPLEIDNRELESLQTSFQEAASRKDAETLLTLSKQVPSRQAATLRNSLNPSTLVLFHFILTDYFKKAVECLQTTINNENILSVVMAAFYFKWFLSKDLSSDQFDLTHKLDEAMLSSQNQVTLATWCRFMHWRLSVKLPSHRTHKKFLRGVAPTCQTTKDILAISSLLGDISKRVKIDDRRKLEEQFAHIMLQNPKIWYEDDELMGSVCLGLYRVNNGQRVTDRRLNTFIWDVVVHKMKHDNSEVLSKPLEYCLKLAGVSMHKAVLRDYPYMLEKCFSSIRAIHSKLCRTSPSASVELFSNIVSSHHVDVSAAKKLLQQSVNTPWDVQPLQLVDKVVYAMANYGCTDKTVLSLVLKTILSPGRETEFIEQPYHLHSILNNLACMQIFPHRLLVMLFDQALKDGTTSLSPSSRRFVVFLNGTLPILCPEYKGPRFDEDTIRELLLKIQTDRGKGKYADDTVALFQQMTRLQNSLQSLPPIVGRYIVQLKPSLQHFVEDDLMMITTDPSVSNVVILLNTERHFLRLYNESCDVHYQLRAARRSKIAQLRKLGYITIAINFDEYISATNHSQLLMDKLKAAKVI
ncbi:uncharacterized protein [Watersipora subatra]|uniref:uncharacterized protein n=1 Tax=Watersipora subatra TaxID=2589382 RepID=UPI00355C43B1